MTSMEKALALQKRHSLTGITFDLVATLDQHAKEQRQRCANKAGKAAHDKMAFWAVAKVYDACINAAEDV